jgi:hypothetical protein
MRSGMANVPVRPGSGDVAEDSPERRRDVVERLEGALDRGQVTTRDVERLLERAAAQQGASARPTAALALYAAGAIVVFGGLALAYATIFGDLPRGLRQTTPFLFPLAACAACVFLFRRRLATWQVELAGLVAYAALAGACVAVGATSGWLDRDHDLALYALVCAVLCTAFVIVLFAVIRSLRLLALGLGTTLSVLGLCVAELSGLLRESTWCWVLLAEAGAAAGAGVLLAQRNRHACAYASYWAMIGVLAAAISGISVTGPEHFSIWHVVLAAAVVAAFLVAGAMSFNGLLWLAALAGLEWLLSIAQVVGSATNAAFAVVLAGLGLVGLGVLVTRLNRRMRMRATR